MGELNFCTIGDIFKLIQIQLLSDVTSDAGIPLVVTRILHNKLYYTLFFGARCYSLYFDLTQIASYIAPILLPFIFYAIFSKTWRTYILTFFFCTPIFMILFFGKISLQNKILIFQIFYLIIAVIGCLKIWRDVRKKK
jgi:hypothetical protein